MKDLKTLYKATERRLYRYPILCARIDAMKQDIAALEDMDYVDRFDAQIERLNASVFADEYEVRVLRRALNFVRDDPYYLSIEYKYFRRMTDKQAILELHCSLSTLRRNRKFLMRAVIDALYGMEAEQLKLEGEKNE